MTEKFDPKKLPENFYRAVLECAPDGFLLINMRGRILDVNSMYCQVSGFDRNELTSMNLRGLQLDTPEEISSHIRQAKNRGFAIRETSHRTKNEKIVAVEVIMTHFRIADDEYIAAFVRDITERKRNDQFREEFISVIHDLRSPLNVVKNHAELLKQSERLNPAGEKSIAAILRNCDRMALMIHELSEAACLEAAEYQLVKKPTSLHELVRGVIATEISADDQQRIVLCEPDDSTVVLGDESRLKRAIVNLIGNALKYSPKDTLVKISVVRQLHLVELTISDEGAGICPEELPHIFERFYRSARTAGKEGLGLGLYICSLTIKKHGGQIWAESEADKGSTFHITLPLA